jgi:hypothetical protein
MQLCMNQHLVRSEVLVQAICMPRKVKTSFSSSIWSSELRITPTEASKHPHWNPISVLFHWTGKCMHSVVDRAFVYPMACSYSTCLHEILWSSCMLACIVYICKRLRAWDHANGRSDIGEVQSELGFASKCKTSIWLSRANISSSYIFPLLLRWHRSMQVSILYYSIYIYPVN